MVDFPEIKEFDINPLLVLEEGKGARVVDALGVYRAASLAGRILMFGVFSPGDL